MLIRINDKNNFECKCQQCQKEYKEFDAKDILKTFVSEFFCSNCKQKLFLYQENVKCVSCKSLLCMNCKIIHLKNCFSLNYIKMYEVGYKCEIHNEMYVALPAKKIYANIAKLFIIIIRQKNAKI